MVVLHQTKDIGRGRSTYAKFFLDLPLWDGLSFGSFKKTEDMGLHRGYGILHFLAYSLFKFTGKEVGENLEVQDYVLGVIGHRFSFLLIVSLLTIIVKKPSFG